MSDENWAQIRVPILMVKEIDELLKLDIMKKNGVFSRSEFATRVIGGWLTTFQKEFGIFVHRAEGQVTNNNIITEEIRKEFPTITGEQWTRLETDTSFRDGFSLALSVFKKDIKISKI